jgi:CubicO group peptidase (beta-lactamase class C family)
MAFEIGCVTKTMTAAPLAEFIARGEVTLDDPLAKLPPREQVYRRSTIARSLSATSSPTRRGCRRSLMGRRCFASATRGPVMRSTSAGAHLGRLDEYASAQ